MVDARYPERWLHDQRFYVLSAEAHRLYVIALTVAVANRTDGRVAQPLLAMLPACVDQGRADELVKADLWRRDRDGYAIVDFEATQSSRAELEQYDARRAKWKQQKQQQRGKSKETSAETSTETSARTPQARPGKARQGSAPMGAELYGPETDEHDWPQVAQPGSGVR